MTGPGPGPNCRRLVRGGPGWPQRLEDLKSPPEVLWSVGTVPPGRPAVAVVGSRRPTLAGSQIAHDLGRDLARLGVQVISGFARGIDAAAHRGALAGGGSTVAVLGCGLDQPYPREHGELRREITAAGSLLSEHPAGVAPLAFHFPLRNRLIAALAAAVVVVEATDRSGALSTAGWAADLGRDVLAVPGSIRSDRSVGCNRLIRDGARPLLDVGDVAEALGLPGPESSLECGAGSAPLEPALDEVFSRLGPDPVHPDALGVALGLDAATLAGRLTALELLGVVRTFPGGLVATSARPD